MSTAIPRIRDFRGLNPRSFDGRGNYTLGVREQIIFPEIDYDAIDQVRGLDVTITTTAQTDAEAFALLHAFGMPFAKEGRPGDEAAEEARLAAEEEARLAEAHARAEAEQAALEQLKEENPEAYAKPEPKLEEGEARGRGRRSRPVKRDRRKRIRIKWRGRKPRRGLERLDGQDFPARAPAAPAQVQDPCVHPLPPLRPGALGVPQVRGVPYLPARAGAQRLHPRHDQVFLVGATPCR